MYLVEDLHDTIDCVPFKTQKALGNDPERWYFFGGWLKFPIFEATFLSWSVGSFSNNVLQHWLRSFSLGTYLTKKKIAIKNSNSIPVLRRLTSNKYWYFYVTSSINNYWNYIPNDIRCWISSVNLFHPTYLLPWGFPDFSGSVPWNVPVSASKLALVWSEPMGIKSTSLL